jgi:hypothetical protein
MPAKEAGLNTGGFLRVMIIGTSLVFYILLSSRGSNTSGSFPAPTISLLATGTPSAPIVGAAQDAAILVIPTNNNQYDTFDIKNVVIRVGDPLGANQDLPKVDLGTGGPFRVPCTSGQKILVWAPGYEIKSGLCNNQEIIYLPHLDAIDNTNYIWAFASIECNACHGNQLLTNSQTGASYDEMNEWFRSGHAKVFNGGYFESMYQGTSQTGKPSIPAQPVIIDNEWVPVPPEKSQDYHGPGFQLDFPGQPGNCTYCHVPTSVSSSQAGMDLSFLFPKPQGSWGEGVTCDVCHKVFNVTLADDKFPFPDRPGILSYRFLRPNSGIFITGPFSNMLTKRQDGSSITVDHHSTCTPVFSQSEFCAPCHFGKFGDMVVYNSYGEWKASPFAANPADYGYRTCQDCHMSHLSAGSIDSLSSQRQACSADNRNFQNFDHNMMDFGMDSVLGYEIPRMVKGAAEIGVTVGTGRAGTNTNTLDVNVTVTNTKAGHNFPTDSPLRHLILVVKAEDRVRTPLIQVDGSRIPTWAGPGPISSMSVANNLMKAGILDYGGLPGKIFANLLVEEETNLSPGMAYWNETKYASVDSVEGMNSDTRLRPGKPDLSSYSFAMPDAGEVKITIQLLYRYAFYDLMVWKEWFDRPDILVTSVTCQGPPSDPSKITCQSVAP